MIFPPPDIHYLRAAAGWLELRHPREALAELEQLSAENRIHPEVLGLRWLIYAELKDWSAALEVAGRLVELAPERPDGWLHRAYALRRAPGGGLVKAWEALLPAREKFPDEAIIPYNLACYACQLERLDDARDWLRVALQAGKPKEIRALALADEDLRPLWGEVAGL